MDDASMRLSHAFHSVRSLWLLVLLTAAAQAQEPEPIPKEKADVTAAVDRGLDFLVSTQNENGSWTGRTGYKLNDEYHGKVEGEHVGFTAIAGLALLGSGERPWEGKYAKSLTAARNYVVDVARRRSDGYITWNGTRVYEHAYAIRFLAEAHRIEPDETAQAVLEMGVKCLLAAQNDEGGWRYQPYPRDADLCVTATVLHALFSAREAGVEIPKDAVERGLAYVQRCAKKSNDGSFAYQDLPGHQTRFTYATTAAGTSCLARAGRKDAPECEKGMAYLTGHRRELCYGEYPYLYGHSYAVQAGATEISAAWGDYRRALLKELLLQQKSNGSWEDEISPIYATGMAVLILERLKG